MRDHRRRRHTCRHIHLAVISVTGQPVADREFPTTKSGYRSAIEFLSRHGVPRVVGVEGTSSYGAGLTRALAAEGIPVVEVCRPDRAARRCKGKSDTLDSYAAARAALSGHGVSEPKDERTSVVRALLSARRSAVKARTASINQIKALLVSAPESVRARFRHHTSKELIAELTRTRPSAHAEPMILEYSLLQRHSPIESLSSTSRLTPSPASSTN
ncbi:IS110 family transposase [Nocardia sp. CA-119907]|uniref:IS110 family transposase n=1 Tax=Nocardia sp. CA-119907 TaxID=3239973 RepID=UPI003D972E0E